MKRKVLVLGLAVAIMLGVGSCGRDDGVIRVLLDWTPNTNHTGLFVALEKGWFYDEGLSLVITQPPEDNALVLVAAQRAHFAFTFQEQMGPAIGRVHDSLPITAVAAIISHNTSGIMSLRESGIQRPADLSGKSFASWDIPVVTAIIRHIVESDGGDFSSVRMVPNFATDVFSALQTDVDAVWIYYAWDGIAGEIKGIEFDYIDLGTFDSLLDFYTPVLVANTNWAFANPETVKAFMRAVSKGYNFAIENPQEAAEILLRHAPELDRELILRSQEFLQTRYQGSAERWGEIDAQRWGRFFYWMYEQDLLEVNIGTGGFTNEFLP
ncbi:MAG: ABC transporter substrate-binding protein [Treponema sp.]|nr:ABC transporter substrate-binding protein [Treponema sp.]